MTRIRLDGGECRVCRAPIRGGAILVCSGCGETFHGACLESGESCPGPGCGGTGFLTFPKALVSRILEPSSRPPAIAAPSGSLHGLAADLCRRAARDQDPVVADETSRLTAEVLALEGRRADLDQEVQSSWVRLGAGMGTLALALIALDFFLWTHGIPAPSVLSWSVLAPLQVAVWIAAGFVMNRVRLAVLAPVHRELVDLDSLQICLAEALEKSARTPGPTGGPVPAAPGGDASPPP